MQKYIFQNRETGKLLYAVYAHSECQAETIAMQKNNIDFRAHLWLKNRSSIK